MKNTCFLCGNKLEKKAPFPGKINSNDDDKAPKIPELTDFVKLLRYFMGIVVRALQTYFSPRFVLQVNVFPKIQKRKTCP